MQRSFLVKPVFIAIIILNFGFLSCASVLAQQVDTNSDPLTLKINEITKEIEELKNKKEPSVQESQLLLDLNKTKAVLEQKIKELSSGENKGGAGLNNKGIRDMRKRIKEVEPIKDAAAKEASLKEALANDPELQARILAKELALGEISLKESLARDPELQARISAKELALSSAASLDKYKADLAAARAKDIQEMEAWNKQAEEELTDRCLICKAVANDKIEVCKEVKDKNRGMECRQSYIALKLFGELNKHKQVTNAALDICKEVFGDNKPAEDQNSSCKLICNAYLTGDFGPVMNYFQGEGGAIGLAFFSGDAKYCNYGSKQSKEQENCLSNASFSAAIRSNNKMLCSEINNYHLKTVCQVYFDRDEKKCEDSMAVELSKRREKIEK